MKGRLVVMSCDSPVSLARFRPSVPSPLPVSTVMLHCVSGAAVTAETSVMDGLVRPEFASVKLLAVSSEIGAAKVTSQVTEVAFVELPDGTLRLIETTVVSGRSTGVQVWVPIAGAAVQGGSGLGAGSVVSMPPTGPPL